MGMVVFLVPMAVGYLAEKGTEKIFDILRKRKEEKTTKALECKINEAFQQLKKKMKALQEYFKELQESRQCEHQFLKAELEKKNQGKQENFARVLLSRMEKEIQILFQSIQTLGEDVQEWPETTKYELQLLRAYLEKNQEKKEEEISRALVCSMIRKFRQLLRRIETLEEYLQNLLKSSQHEFHLLRADQEK